MSEKNTPAEVEYKKARDDLQEYGYLHKTYPNPPTPDKAIPYIEPMHITMDDINEYLVTILTSGPKETGTKQEKETYQHIKKAASTLLHQALQNEKNLATATQK